MEVCVDSVQSAINAEKGGANRIELCANLFEGGTTPTIGTLRTIKRHVTRTPVFVMIRPRGGDFLYDDVDMETMTEDARQLRDAGADGFVFGILTADGNVDKLRCSTLLDLIKPRPATFHRAFDVVRDPVAALEDVIELGFARVLTSGLDSSALEGAPTIRKLVEQAEDRIIIMPGGGITEKNLDRILTLTGATEFHCSARKSIASGMRHVTSDVFMGAALRPLEYGHKVCDVGRVQSLIKISKSQ